MVRNRHVLLSWGQLSGDLPELGVMPGPHHSPCVFVSGLLRRGTVALTAVRLSRLHLPPVPGRRAWRAP